jgi:hypothetical protein
VAGAAATAAGASARAVVAAARVAAVVARVAAATARVEAVVVAAAAEAAATANPHKQWSSTMTFGRDSMAGVDHTSKDRNARRRGAVAYPSTQTSEPVTPYAARQVTGQMKPSN